MTKLRSW